MVGVDFLRNAMIGFLVCWSTKAAFVVVSVLLTIVLTQLSFWIIVFLIQFVCEFVHREIVTAWHDYQRQPPAPFANPWPHWEVVAELRPSWKETIEQVTQLDADPIDDPLHPHVSIVYVVGVRKRNSFWRTITIWRVSTLTGQRKRVCDFAYFDLWCTWKTICFRVYAFQSRGVIFIHVRHIKEFHVHSSLLIYDVRHEKRAEVNLGRHSVYKYRLPLAIRCLGRRVKDRSIEGWWIRFLFSETERMLNEELQWHEVLRDVFVNAVADVSASSSKSLNILSQEALLFPYSRRTLVRSATKVGLYQKNAGRRTFVYDTEANRFEYFPNLAAFVNSSDEAFKKYYAKRAVLAGNLRGAYPAAITDREVVLKLVDEAVLIRTRLQPPTLLMLAAQALFKASPKVAKLKAARFREMTGVDLSAHFA